MKKRYLFCALAASFFIPATVAAVLGVDAPTTPIVMRPDLEKPLWTRTGAPICVMREELEVLIAGGESDLCVKSAKEVSVTVSKPPHGFSDIMRIRVRNPEGKLVDFWTVHNALRN